MKYFAILVLSLSFSCANDDEFAAARADKKMEKKLESSDNLPKDTNAPASSDATSKEAPIEAKAGEEPSAEVASNEEPVGDDLIEETTFDGDAITNYDDLSIEVTRTEFKALDFVSSQVAEAELDILSDSVEHKSQVTLETATLDIPEFFEQVTLDRGSPIKLDQGHPAISLTETFNTDLSYGAIDILVVVDNSGSMGNEQAKLAPQLASLLTYVDHASWQVSVITTDARNKECGSLIKKGDPGYIDAFKQDINDAGTRGSGNERGFYQAMHGLSCKMSNKDWLQPNSAVAVLIVSDEDNCSRGCTNAAEGTNSLKNFLATLRPSGSTGVFGIIDVPDQNGKSTCSTAYNVSRQYQAEIVATGGTSGSICDNSYAPTLQAISSKISTLLKKEFRLMETPVPGSLSVTIDGQPYNDYMLSGKSLVLGGNPPKNKKVEVSYLQRADTIKAAFELGRSDFAPEGFSVKVNGNVQSDSSYTLSGSTLTFDPVPPEAAKIEVDYFVDKPRLDTFTLKHSSNVSNLMVAINTQQTSDYSFDSATGDLRFNSPPPVASKISVSYNVPGDDKLEYSVIADATGHELKGIYDANTGDAIAGATFNNGVLTVLQEGFVTGRMLEVRTKTYSEGGMLRLLSMPIEGSLKVISSDCAEEPVLMQVDDTIGIDCDQADGSTKIGYKFEIDPKKEFDLGEAPAEKSIIRVSVNGDLTKDYVIEGQMIKFAEALPPEASIKYVEIRLVSTAGDDEMN